jgi:hypothetical protein
MTRHWRNLVLLGLAALLAAGLPLLAADDDAVEGEVAVGARAVDTEDNLTRAAEYRSTEDSPVLFGWLDWAEEGSWLSLDLRYEEADEQRHELVWGLSPSLTLDVSFQRLPHNLPHAGVFNLNATDSEGKIVEADDLDPNAQYRLDWENATARLEWQPRDYREWLVVAHARQMRRDGTKQNLSTGHCMTCHIVSQTQPLDRTTTDVGLTVGYQKPSWGVRYDITAREFSEDAMTPDRAFGPAIHPVSKLPVFGNRIQYPDPSTTSVTLPVGLVVEHERTFQTLSAYWNGGDNHVDGVLSWAHSESDLTGLEADYASARARWLHRFAPATQMVIHGRYETIDTDEIFVDVVEPTSVAPPFTAGLTYEELYGPDGTLRENDDFRVDFVRKSAADRNVLTAQADLVHRYGAERRQRVKLSLRSREIDREYKEVDEGTTETQEYRLRALLTGRWGDQIRYRGDVTYLQADSPFTNVNGGVRAAGVRTNPTELPVGGPWTSQQYFELYRLRFGDLTNQPNDSIRLKGNVAYTPAADRSMIVHGSWTDQENDETEVSSWERTGWSIGSAIWWAPTDRMYAVVTADRIEEDQETHISVPLMDG